MPTVKDKITGAVISRQPYNDKGARNASTIAESNPSWEVTHEDIPSSDARERSKYQYGGNIPSMTSMREAREYGEDMGGQKATRMLEQGLMEEDVKSPMRWESYAEKEANKRADRYQDKNRSMAEKLGVRNYKKGGKTKK